MKDRYTEAVRFLDGYWTNARNIRSADAVRFSMLPHLFCTANEAHDYIRKNLDVLGRDISVQRFRN